MYAKFFSCFNSFTAKLTTDPESNPPLNCEPTPRFVRKLEFTAF